jgi:pilus assembly protein CpaE
MTNILAVAVDTELVNRIASIPEHRLVSISRENLASVRDVSFHPDLIFVGTGLTHQQALQYAQGVLHTYPRMAIVLIAEPDRQFIRQAKRAGIRGVIARNISDRDLANVIKSASTSARASRPAVQRPHQVIVIASPKGGVGKTTTAVSLAALLAEDAPGEVVLLDLDLQFGDVAALLDLHPEFTVADALNSGANDSMLLRTLLVAHPANFHVLCGADHPAAAGQANGDSIRKLVSQFASTFTYVVIDTSAGLQEETLASLEEATDVVFVAALDVATLRNVRKEVDVLAELGLLPERRHVVLNRTDRLSGLTVGDAEAIVGLPVSMTIPVSTKVPLAANHARLAVQDRTRKGVRRHYQKFARQVTDISVVAPHRVDVASARSQRPGRHK